MFSSRLCLSATWKAAKSVCPRKQTMVHISKMSTQEGIQISVIDEKKGVAEISLQKPPVNSLDRSMLTGITEGVGRLEKEGCRAVIITSGVRGIFSGGLNLLDLYQQKSEDLGQYWGMVQEMFLTLYASSLISVACITGAAPAAGCLVATSCDYRIMVDAPKTTIGLNESLIGMPVPDWMRINFSDVVGKRQTDLALQMGLLFSGKEALRVGLVDELADTPEGVRERALALISQYLRVPDVGRVTSKRIHTEPLVSYLSSRRQKDVELFVAGLQQERIQAVMGQYLAALKSKAKAK